MDLGWKVMIPASLAWFMLLAVQRLGRDLGWNIFLLTAVSLAVLGACFALMQRAFTVSMKTRKSEGSMF
jgi:NADH:ubiquinone oxidoreductase subunit H